MIGDNDVQRKCACCYCWAQNGRVKLCIVDYVCPSRRASFVPTCPTNCIKMYERTDTRGHKMGLIIIFTGWQKKAGVTRGFNLTVFQGWLAHVFSKWITCRLPRFFFDLETVKYKCILWSDTRARFNSTHSVASWMIHLMYYLFILSFTVFRSLLYFSLSGPSVYSRVKGSRDY